MDLEIALGFPGAESGGWEGKDRKSVFNRWQRGLRSAEEGPRPTAAWKLGGNWIPALVLALALSKSPPFHTLEFFFNPSKWKV